MIQEAGCRRQETGSLLSRRNGIIINSLYTKLLKKENTILHGFEDLTIYQKAFSLAMDIFKVSKSFPKEEIYSRTDQIRRSSRSVCTNTAEAYRKKRYPAHFISKVTDADTENSETLVWLNFSKACKYISKEKYIDLRNKTEEVGRLIGGILQNHENFS